MLVKVLNGTVILICDGRKGGVEATLLEHLIS